MVRQSAFWRNVTPHTKTLRKGKQVVINAQQWQQVQNQLREEVGVDGFDSWLSPLQPDQKNSSDSALTLHVPTAFMKDWIARHYAEIIQRNITTVLQRPLDIDYIVRPVFETTEETAPAVMTASSPSLVKETTPATIEQELYQGNALDPRYTFENFVTGKSNEFAYAAARRIAETEDLAYNPFFLYGGVGLGKTHLMHAIAHHICRNFENRSVLYISAEKFLFQFVRALRDKSTLSFKETFRSVDVLMIDDIQFIAGKEATQEEFFHTFNALVDMRKQVILTADKSPHEMANLEDRLRSRLGSGLATEIHTPDVETRLAILSKKAESLGMDLPRDVAMLLANGIASNVRELEGALNRLAAHAQLVSSEITLDFAREQLRDLFSAYNRTVTLDEIQQEVAKYYNIKVADLHGVRRNRDVARPRQIAMFLCKQLTTRSFPEIGRAFGGRDHTTVIHAVKKVEELMRSDQVLAEDTRILETTLTK